MNDADLIKNIDSQKALMIAVSTGGPRIDDVNEEYKKLWSSNHAELLVRKIEDPNPYTDLWQWYGKWSSGDLPSYQSRRNYLAELYDPLIKRIHQPDLATVEFVATGWTRVDRNVDSIRQALENADTEELFQAVGLMCREAIISLAQAVYDPTIHPTLDGLRPSETDAIRMLDAFLSKELRGSSNEEARAHAKSAFKLSLALQHRRTATFRDTALCTEATRSVINLVAIISGRSNTPES